MLSAIDLNYDSLIQTDKVYDVATQGMLSPELVTPQLPQAKMTPQKPLGIGRIIPQFFGSRSGHAPPILSFPPRRGKEL